MYQFLNCYGVFGQPHHGDNNLVLNLCKVILSIWYVLLIILILLLVHTFTVIPTNITVDAVD